MKKPLECFGGKVLQWPTVLHTGVVHQNVDGLARRFVYIDGCSYAMVVRRVKLQCVRTRNTGRCRCQLCLIATVQHNLCAGGSQTFGKGKTNALRRPRDQCAPPRQIEKPVCQVLRPFSSLSTGVVPPVYVIVNIPCQAGIGTTMTKPHILQIGPYPEWDQGPLDETYHMHRYFESADKDAFLAQFGPQVRGIATRGELGANAAIIAACTQLEVISVYGVGYDAVDLNAARARGIRVTNTPDVLTNDVADLGVAMMLVQSRGMIRAEHWVRDGSWATKGLYPLQRRVWGKRVGVLGLGRIGFEVAKRLEGFDLEIAYSDVVPKDFARNWEFIADPVALAARSDFLFVTLAASAATRHIVGAAVIDALGPEGMLINVSRASNIDEEALLAALEQGRLGSAALDVFEGEPKLNPRFLTLPNVLVQPHHASGTYETRQAMGKLLRDNLTAHFAGQPLLTPVL